MYGKIIFGLILRFSPNSVLSNRKVFPFFFEAVVPIAVKNFLWVLVTNRSACFFSSSKSSFYQMWQPFQSPDDRQKISYWQGLQYFCFSWPVKMIFFKRETKHAPYWFLVTMESLRSNGWAPDFFRRKNFWSFWTLWLPKNPVAGIRAYLFYDKFHCTQGNLSTVRVSFIFVQPFLRNP